MIVLFQAQLLYFPVLFEFFFCFVLNLMHINLCSVNQGFSASDGMTFRCMAKRVHGAGEFENHS